jgi:hypothetical protein
MPEAERIWDDAMVSMARHITEARVNEPINEIGVLESDVENLARPLWRNAHMVPVGPEIAGIMRELTEEAMITGQTIMAMHASDAQIGVSKGLNGAGSVPMYPAGIPAPSAREQLNDRLYSVGYQLQQLEQIRREMSAIGGLEKVEELVNAAIEVLGSKWMADRRTYRDMK